MLFVRRFVEGRGEGGMNGEEHEWTRIYSY